MAALARDATRLWVGTDSHKVVVATQPLTMRSGRGTRRRRGIVCELVPVPPSGLTRRTRVWHTVRLAAAVTVLAMVLTALGLPLWALAPAGAGLVWYTARLRARAAATGLVAVPRAVADVPIGHALHASADRVTFIRCLATAHRIQRTWPDLAGMIDRAEAADLLAKALWDLAAVLARRQQIRQLRDDLAAVPREALPAASPALAALRTQQDRVGHLWRRVNADVRHRAESLLAAAVAGEDLIREQQAGQQARRAEHALARLTAAAHPTRVDPGQDLADRASAVVAAYRELARHEVTG